MNKESLKSALLALQEKSIENLQERIQTAHSMVDIDETDVLDPEDLSHQSESSESEKLFQQQLEKAKADVALIEKIDFSSKNSVEPGAIVVTEKFNFVVACATTPFDFEGRHITGISVDSPIYREMKGLSVGDSFTQSGHTYSILEIH